MDDCLIRIAQYRGVSPISWIIRTFTRSPWSHTLAIHRDDSITESWIRGGVSHVDKGNLLANLSANHKDGTVVDLFTIEATTEQAEVFEAFLLEQVGMPYDLSSVFRFLIHKPASLDGKWFCSELASCGLSKVGIHVQERITPSHISPQLHGISPLMIPAGSIITGTGEIYAEDVCNQS